MAIWDRLLKRIISPVIEESVNELNKEQDKKKDEVEKALVTQQLPSFSFSPVGIGKLVNRSFPRGVSFQVLREFANYYPILRSCVNFRKRQILQLDYDITSREVIVDKKVKEQYKKDADDLKQFLRYPSGDKTLTFRDFLNKVLEDLIVLDAVTIYRRKNRKGGLYGFLPIDASTIEIVLNEDGTTPAPPSIAYIQKINGQVTAELTADDLIYKKLNSRTNTPYGLSPIESLILVVTTALKLSSYNLSILTDGNVPEGFVELPKDIASDPKQLTLWQEAWDAMFSGDPRFQRKIKFLPEGMKWTATRKAEDMDFERFEKWLLMQCCSVLEVAPQAIGFQFERGKGATESEWEIGKERGLFPTALFLKEVMDHIIQEDLGQEHLQFVWTNINPTNKKEEAEVFKSLVSTGAVSVDEWRLGEGLEPIGLGNYIMTPVGPIMVKDFVDSSEAGTPLLPYNYQQNPQGTETKPVVPPTGGEVKQKLGSLTRAEIVEELRRWKKTAINDLKQEKTFRDFKTDIIDLRTQNLIKDGLKNVSSREELDQLFDPFINQESKMLDSVFDLYEEVNSIVENARSVTTNTTIKAGPTGN
jgi:HK97 family phage portal protein